MEKVRRESGRKQIMYSSDWKDLISAFGYGFVDDKDQYKNIVKVFAYKDMQPRTIVGLRKFQENKVNKAKLEKVFDWLAEELYDFVVNKRSKKTQEKFDEWHKKTGEGFCKKFNNVTGATVDKIKFGKAQKIVNVSFKYIYCLKGADKYIDKFEFCHMTLDRYTYSEGFYKKEVITWNNSDPSRKKINSPTTSWSNLEYKDYIAIQNNVRDFLSNTKSYFDKNTNNLLTPFQAEFYIFNKYR